MKPFQSTLLQTGLVACLLSACISCWGQYSLVSSKISSGGGTSTNGQYSLTATIGQPDASHMAGGGYTLDGGFWGFLGVVQTPDAPKLSLTRSGANVILSWAASGNFTLQSTSDLAGKPVWTTIAQTPARVGEQFQVTLPASLPRQFFRLKQ